MKGTDNRWVDNGQGIFSFWIVLAVCLLIVVVGFFLGRGLGAVIS